MGKTKVVSLTAEQRAELEKGYRTEKSHCFRLRCQMILLKSEERTFRRSRRGFGMLRNGG